MIIPATLRFYGQCLYALLFVILTCCCLYRSLVGKYDMFVCHVYDFPHVRACISFFDICRCYLSQAVCNMRCVIVAKMIMRLLVCVRRSAVSFWR